MNKLTPMGNVATAKLQMKMHSKAQMEKEQKKKKKQAAEKKSSSSSASPSEKKITGKGGKTVGDKANVTKEQLAASGLSLRQYMNQWNKTGKRPGAAKPKEEKKTKAAEKKAPTKVDKRKKRAANAADMPKDRAKKKAVHSAQKAEWDSKRRGSGRPK